MTPRTSAVLAGAAVAAGMIFPACSGGTKVTPADPPPAIPVTAVTLALTDAADTFEVGGVVQARTTATLMSRILAPVVEVRAAAGDRVRAGQVLIVLDGRDLAAQARRARAASAAADQDLIAAAAERQAAEAALVLARSSHVRIASLVEKRSATPQELDDVTAALHGAEARAAAAAARAQAAVSGVEGARAASESADATATFSRLAAPFDGVVTGTPIEPGNLAAPGTPLMRVEDAGAFRLDVRIDETRIAQLVPGSIVPVSFDARPGVAQRMTSGTVTEVSRAVDAGTRAFLVKIALPADAGLRSGMFGRAHFAASSRPRLTVPLEALVRHGQVTSVFAVENDVARLRFVSLDEGEVLSGLSEGDVVIVAPPPALADGRRVRAGGR